MAKPTITTTTTVKREGKIELSNVDIVEFLIHKGLIEKAEEVEEVFVRVPGGGDYSNHDLTIDDETSITVVLKTVQYEM